MLVSNIVEKRALKILLRYNALAEWYISSGYPLSEKKMRYAEEHCISIDERAFLLEKGLGFEARSMTHDEALRKSFFYFKSCNKNHVIALFLSGLSITRLDYRSGLPAFAIMQTMPEHKFESNQASFCRICSASQEDNHIDLTELNRQRFSSGGLAVYKTPYEISFFLEQQLKLEVVQPSEKDFSIFNAILKIIVDAQSGEKLTSIIKKIKAIDGFKITTDQCRCLLETLGFCGILETKEHKGYLTYFTNPGLAPSKSHSSNWAYPVDFWTGGDGINRDALKFWFGEYKEIVI
ncbi:hypothetical protein [Escherichia sp. 93.1518]|uniref:hypothetical protein n=1 Tax=Escherichia sp. 93.1518 TaxID=2723311 RepID=UPI001594C50B|nr:hypothetical protein [Escherichia sp. 93.1518]EJV7175466.1 hypothetical protein [Escherichia coli]MBB2319707.1 hypothetical protein [Escherichia sp. 93.1518]